MSAQKHVLVTGGFGFLGGHLLEMLLERPDVTVHVVDNLSSNPVDVETLLQELPESGRLTYDLCSIADYFASGPGEFDQIVHLASPVGPAGVLKHGGRIVSSVVEDTYLLADYAIESRARLLDVSTSEVYGGGRDGLCDEEDDKIVPAAPSFRLEYAVGKLAAETALANLHKRDGLNVVIVRPFNIAGPRQSGEGGFVLPRFVAQAMLGLPLTIFGTGEARRAFTHVNDIARGLMLALDHGRAGIAYNLGHHGNVITVEELAEVVLEVTGSASERRYLDPTEIYGTRFVEANDKFPSAGRAIRELGWEPRRDVHQIVYDTWEYMRNSPSRDFARLAGAKVIEQLLEAQQTLRS